MTLAARIVYDDLVVRRRSLAPVRYAKCPNPFPSSNSRTITFSPRFTDSSAATPITTLQKPSSAVAAMPR